MKGRNKKGLKMRYTTMDVGNIFKSLFGIYKTTKLLMQHHIVCIHRTHNKICTGVTLQENNFSLCLSRFKVNKVQKVAARVALLSRRSCASYRAEVQQVAQLLVGAQSRHPLLLHPARTPRPARTYKHGHTRRGDGWTHSARRSAALLVWSFIFLFSSKAK